VLPGVCMMQIFKELLEKAINKKLFLFRADNSKFLMMVNPSQTPQLTFTIDFAITDDIVKANGVLKNDAAVFLKLSNYSFKYDR
jgi:3-hydroxyacyl-[acyl-carrier-protein] dehydratase